MEIALGMRSLVEDITLSRQGRAQKTADIKGESGRLREETRDFIKSLQTGRKDSAFELDEQLGREAAGRKSEVKKLLGNTRALVTAFHSGRNKQGIELRRELTRGAAERKSRVSEILIQANQALSDFNSSRRKMGLELRKELAGSLLNNKTTVNELLTQSQKLVLGFSSSRREAGDILRKSLASDKAGRVTNVMGMQNEFQKARAGVRAEIKEAVSLWHELVTPVARTAARVRKATTPLPEAEPNSHILEERPGLETRLLETIEGYPAGITLVEIADHLGVVPIVLGRAARKLLKEGKIGKENKHYYSLAGK